MPHTPGLRCSATSVPRPRRDRTCASRSTRRRCSLDVSRTVSSSTRMGGGRAEQVLDGILAVSQGEAIVASATSQPFLERRFDLEPLSRSARTAAHMARHRARRHRSPCQPFRVTGSRDRRARGSAVAGRRGARSGGPARRRPGHWQDPSAARIPSPDGRSSGLAVGIGGFVRRSRPFHPLIDSAQARVLDSAHRLGRGDRRPDRTRHGTIR